MIRLKHPRSTKNARGEGGFTLIEVAMAIAILAVMVTLNYQIVRSIIEAKFVLDDQRDGMFIANSVLTRLSRELQLAVGNRGALLPDCSSVSLDPEANDPQQQQQQRRNVPQLLLKGEERSIGTAQGRGDTITFLAREAGQYVPDGGTHSGVVQITYRVEPNPDQPNDEEPTFLLIRDEVPYRRPASRACQNAIRFPITQNLLSLEFQYYDQRNEEWVQSWDQTQVGRLPAIVQFSLRLRTPAGQIETFTTAVPISAK